jgi:predicted transcriptional regulator
MEQGDLVGLSAAIVSAYVSNNSVQGSEIPGLLASVHAALSKAGSPASPAEPRRPEPAVNPKKSVTPDYIISLFDGRKYKSLRRYIMTSHNMTPDQYRQYWGLPSDYPMVAPNYAKVRSELAKSIGLGQKRLGKSTRKGRKKAA